MYTLIHTYFYVTTCLVIIFVGITIIFKIIYKRFRRQTSSHTKFDSIKRNNSEISYYQCETRFSTVKTAKPAWYNTLQEELDRMPIGNFMFNPPKTMVLGVNERIETRIAKDLDCSLVNALKGRGFPKIENLKISELMKVHLSGNNFDINALNEEEQIVSKEGYTEWAWDVTPLKSGVRKLHLHVTLRIRLPFGEEKKDCPALDHDVEVKINVKYSIKKFFVKYWQWIATSLVIPLTVWIWKLYAKH
jgi:hypothetical protein